MALIRCDFFSEVLQVGSSMTVLLPQTTTSQVGVSDAAPAGDPPVLYLLHGNSDDDTSWTRRTALERYVAPLGLAVVMPQVGRSFYTDMANGGRYWTFLSEELPELVESFFRVSTRREDTYVAGLSMGGYGAMKWALRQPERFAAAASMSGALDLATLVVDRSRAELWRLVHGDRQVAGTDEDLFALLAQAAGRDDLPALRVDCGTEDQLYDGNLRFVAEAERHGIAVDTHFGPGIHEWAYWDAEVREVLAWLPLRRSA